jgi:hypothetical protein
VWCDGEMGAAGARAAAGTPCAWQASGEWKGETDRAIGGPVLRPGAGDIIACSVL